MICKELLLEIRIPDHKFKSQFIGNTFTILHLPSKLWLGLVDVIKPKGPYIITAKCVNRKLGTGWL